MTDRGDRWPGFGVENLPFGVARLPGGRIVCVSALDGHVIDLASLAATDVLAPPADLFARSSLNAFLGCGREMWEAVRRRLAAAIAAGDDRLTTALVPRDEADLLLPIAVGDFVDYSASLHHAARMGRLLRPQDDPVPPHRRLSPIAYHGRSGTIVASGTPLARPHGHAWDRDGNEARVVPSAALDVEAEVGFVVGVGSTLGVPVPTAAFRDRVAGVVLVNDWSARDFQAYESRPLGPFLGKSFATSMSPWLVTLEALEPYLVPAEPQAPAMAAYLAAGSGFTYDLRLEVAIQSERMRASGAEAVIVSRPPLPSSYWTPPQLLAHATVNGSTVRTGDLIASGTVSGPVPGTEGSLTELAEMGGRPLHLPDGTTRAYLEDGDTAVIRGWAGGDGLPLLSLGEVTGTILPARPLEV